MYDAITLTLIILTVALLRRSLLTDSDAAPGVRVDGEDDGFLTLIPARVADRPHPARTVRIKR